MIGLWQHHTQRLDFCTRVLLAAHALYGDGMWAVPLGDEWREWAKTIGLERP